MQLKKDQLMRQQVILTGLGFYRHKIDGIWGPESIAAKRKWEFDRSFNPAIPTNGLPFAQSEKLPRGCYFGGDRLLCCSAVSEEKVKELEARPSVKREIKEDVPVIPSPEYDSTAKAPEQVKAEPAEKDSESESEDDDGDDGSEDNGAPSTNPSQHFLHKKKKRQHR